MPDPAPPRDLLARYHRSLTHYLRALLPDAAAADEAWRDTVERMGRRGFTRPPAEFGPWAEAVAREVAAGRRKTDSEPPFSDDLFRELAQTPGLAPDRAEARARALAGLIPQLPPPERDLLRRRYELRLTVEQMASADGRPPSAVARDLAGLHETLVGAVQAASPDGGPDPPGGAADLGRMADQLLDGTIGDDSRLVLETLLLADAPAQAHYRRHAALVTDLSWAYQGTPPLPDPPAPAGPTRPPLLLRERVVTAAFVAACLATAVLVILLLSGAFR